MHSSDEQVLNTILTNVLGMREDIGSLKGELEGMNKRLDAINGRIGRQEKELSKVKIKAAYISGVIAVVIVVLSRLIQLG